MEIGFWTYFLLAFGVFYLLPVAVRPLLLLIFSYLFYASWNPLFLSLILFSTFVDFFAGQKAHPDSGLSEKKRKAFVYLSLIVNLGLLALFKYFNFFVDDILRITGVGHTEFAHSFIEMGVPVGISFYTFQTLSYTIDAFRGEVQVEKSYIRFSLYVAFFPQLLAGPIERARFLLPQLDFKSSKLQKADFREALPLIFWGIFKKLYVADNLYPIVKTIFIQPQLNLYEVIWASFLTTLVIYCDFSAYSDMAKGMARLFKVKLMTNFRPFLFVKSPDEFWKVWHISLTTWIRDYIYRSIRKSWLSVTPLILQVIIVSLLIGFWHGPDWTWGAWGLSVAFFFYAHRGLNKLIPPSGKGLPLHYIYMFLMYVTLGFWHEARFFSLLLFNDLDFGLYQSHGSILIESLKFITPLALLEWLMVKRKSSHPLEKLGPTIGPAIYASLSLLLLWYPPIKEFIFVYFEF